MQSSARQRAAAPAETSVTQKGRDRAQRILETAVEVFLEQGYANFTVRAVADAAGISIGNLNYYFPRKSALLRAMVEHVIVGYLAEFERRRRGHPQDPQAQLECVLDFWLGDLGTPRTTRFFPELWALANHDAEAARLMDDLYERARLVLVELLREIHPGADCQAIDEVSVVMVAALEGLTLFAGHGKAWSGARAALERRCKKALAALAADA
ncbi:MAG: TetR/AcrR family transcriptional regulator [Gammaproteobacteria bacterium]|nr:TetR/AcrR family transcriptional regulator [Gammaproteobacteria bacterium]